MGAHNITNVGNIDANGIITAQDFVDKNVGGGLAVGTFWSGSYLVTSAGQTISAPACSMPNSAVDAVFVPSHIIFYPNNDAGSAGAQIGAYTIYDVELPRSGATNVTLQVYVQPTDAAAGSSAVLLNPSNSRVQGTILTRCGIT